MTAAVGLAIAGCAEGPAIPGDELEDEDIVETQEAYGEATCGTSATTADVVHSQALCHGGFTDTSPSASYDHATCSHAYVIDYASNSQDFVGATASWVDSLPTTEAGCEGSHIKLTVYGSAGNVLAQDTETGVWAPSPWNICLLGQASTPNEPNVARIVAQAYTYSCGLACGYHYHNVEVRTNHACLT